MDTSTQRQNGGHFADDISKRIFLNFHWNLFHRVQVIIGLDNGLCRLLSHTGLPWPTSCFVLVPTLSPQALPQLPPPTTWFCSRHNFRTTFLISLILAGLTYLVGPLPPPAGCWQASGILQLSFPTRWPQHSIVTLYINGSRTGISTEW